MVFPARRFRPALLLIAVLVPILGACSSALAGSAQIAATASTSNPPTAPPTTTLSSATPTAAASSVDTVVGGWASAELTFGRDGLTSPTGATLRLSEGRACLEPIDGGDAVCAELAQGDRPRTVLFSPDGRHLLILGGPDEQHRVVYVMDTATGAVRVVGPDGVTELSTDPAVWAVSRVGWSSDGSALIVLPFTTGDDGPILAVPIDSDAVGEIARLPADLVNGQPTIHAGGAGIALAAHLTGDRQTVWWVDRTTGSARVVGRFEQPGGSVVVTAVDPPGDGVLACPWNADGSLGATVRFATDGSDVGSGSEGTPLLAESRSCAGTVYSPDGRFLAMTAELDGGYTLLIVDLQADRRVLSTALPVSEPTMPPFLTWLDDTVVATDLSGNWPAPALVIRLRR
jgi:dipeptidyl aminopeptidase/acylaminoacyl peptidase